MRSFLALCFLALACSSSDGLISSAFEGGPGQPISVAIADVSASPLPLNREGTVREYVVRDEVSNNTHDPVTVTGVTITPENAQAAFQVERTSRRFNEMIDPGNDHIFDVPLR